MKKLTVLLVLALSLLGTAARDANAIGVYGIWWMPREDSVDADGWGIGLKEKRSLTPLFAIDGRISYITFSDLDTNIIPIEFTGTIRLGMLYAGIGAGYYFLTGDSNLEDSLNWYALAGIEVLPGPISFFGEIKWQFLEPDFEAGGGSADLESLALHLGANIGILK